MRLGKPIGTLTHSLLFGASLRAFAIALALSPVALLATTTEAPSQPGFQIGFGYFYDELAPYGTWNHHPRWGDVWRPRRVEADFRPYYRGHWEYTNQYGWIWASDHVWGDIPFHYGRWVYDPYDGWLWVPGYVWSPAWVVWRSGGGYTGWFPMPPDDGFLYGGGNPYYNRWDNWDSGFGYNDWYGAGFGMNNLINFWVFIEDRRFADRDYIRYIPPRTNIVNIVNNTTNITNYVTVNNYIVNRSINVDRIERASGRQIARVEARNVLKRNINITTVDQGDRVQQNERRNHGGNRNASARERIVSLPEDRARAIQGGANRERLDRAIGPNGPDRGRDNDNNNKGGPNNDRIGNRGPDNDRAGKGGGPDNNDRGRQNFGNGPNANGPDLDRGRANERRGGPNGPGGAGQNVVGQSQTVGPQQNRGPRNEPQRPQARQQGPQNEGPQSGGGGGGNNNNRRIDRQDQPDGKQGGGGGGGGNARERGGNNNRGPNRDR
jgi:hypothetical protein